MKRNKLLNASDSIINLLKMLYIDYNDSFPAWVMFSSMAWTLCTGIFAFNFDSDPEHCFTSFDLTTNHTTP